MRISAAARAAIAEARDAEVRASAALKKRVREVCAYADGVCEAARDAMDRIAKRQLVDWHSGSWARAWSEAFENHLLRDAQGYFRALQLSLASCSDARSLAPCYIV